MFVCNHPGLSIVNGCEKDKRICCYSCDDEECTNRCINPKCTHKLEVPDEGGEKNESIVRGS